MRALRWAATAVAVAVAWLVVGVVGTLAFGMAFDNAWAVTTAIVVMGTPVLSAVILPLYLSIRSNRRRTAAALAARADYEHGALLAGDTRRGIYGAFPPSADL